MQKVHGLREMLPAWSPIAFMILSTVSLIGLAVMTSRNTPKTETPPPPAAAQLDVTVTGPHLYDNDPKVGSDKPGVGYRIRLNQATSGNILILYYPIASDPAEYPPALSLIPADSERGWVRPNGTFRDVARIIVVDGMGNVTGRSAPYTLTFPGLLDKETASTPDALLDPMPHNVIKEILPKEVTIGLQRIGTDDKAVIFRFEATGIGNTPGTAMVLLKDTKDEPYKSAPSNMFAVQVPSGQIRLSKGSAPWDASLLLLLINANGQVTARSNFVRIRVE